MDAIPAHGLFCFCSSAEMALVAAAETTTVDAAVDAAVNPSKTGKEILPGFSS